MTWNINTIIPLIAFFLYAGLFAVVIFSSPQTKSRKVFRWYLAAMMVWSICALLVLLDLPSLLFWFRLMTASGIGAIASIFYFTQTMLKKKRWWVKYALLYSIISMGLGLSTNLIIKSATMIGNTLDYQFSPWVPIFAGPNWILLIYSVIELIIEYRKSNDVIRRNRIIYLMLGISFIFTGTLINFTPLGKYPIDIAANGVTAILIAYAILRYQLLDITVVIRRGLFYTIPTVIIGTSYFLIITLALRIFNVYSGAEVFLLSLVVALLTALVAEPLRDRAQSWVDRLFFRDRYDSRVMLQNLSSQAASVLNITDLASLILDEVTSILHIRKSAFFLKDEETEKFLLTEHTGLEGIKTLELRRNHPLVLWLSNHDRVLTRHDIEVLPQFKSMWKREREEIESLDAELFIPVKVQQELVGIFYVGPKLSEQVYDQDDILTLSTLANQSAVAIENARLYTAEQNRRKEMDTLYTMARQLVASDDFEAVLNSISEHALKSVNVSYTRILILDENKEYCCRAAHASQGEPTQLGVNKLEPLITEHYYNWILQGGKVTVLDRNDPDLQQEERDALFYGDARHICISPLIGTEEPLGLIVFGEVREGAREPFNTTKMRLINVITDQAASAIQRTLLHEQLEESFLQTVISLANAMDARDAYTSDHSQRMASLSEMVGREMGLTQDQIQAVKWAAILHDIGKIGVPDEILRKPGPLNDKEWETMERHPDIGARIVAPVKKLAPVSPIIRAHHERYDGTGYPRGLKGETIPIESRILSVVDAYIAIRDKRIYSDSHTHEEAITEIRRNSGTQFDPEVVDVFCKIVKDNPYYSENHQNIEAAPF
jgi:putative nucleotidyltransferase with HDIG domain